MPIEIRELVIRATVNPGDGGGGGHCAPARNGPGARAQAPAQGQEDLVQTCVREVLRILEDRRER